MEGVQPFSTKRRKRFVLTSVFFSLETNVSKIRPQKTKKNKKQKNKKNEQFDLIFEAPRSFLPEIDRKRGWVLPQLDCQLEMKRLVLKPKKNK